MKLYYHKTDGGAEYYCLKPIAEDSEEGDVKSALMRVDGGEIELLTKNIFGYYLEIKIS